jgi:poly-gamma-glutamate synthesis protein (capsule biosynthesis protein)
MTISDSTLSNATQAAVQSSQTLPDETQVLETEAFTEGPTKENPRVDINLMMIGDILAHEGVYNSGKYPDGTYNYDHLFTHILSDIEESDIAIVNQEVVLGGVELGLSGYPCFNSPVELGDALATAGFNVVLHATNHALDKGSIGLDNTMSFWKTQHPEIAVLGIHETQEDYDNNNVYIYEQENVRIAILNYTYGTNGIPLPSGREYIVNLMTEDTQDKIASDIAYAKENADFVIVCPHWGTEYVYTPDSSQKYWAQFFADNGVDLVIGTHPHVIEPVEWVQGSDGHFMLVYYSLGNFVSNQDRIPRMLGAMAKVTITKKDGLTYISNYGVEPLVTHKLFGTGLITTYHLSEYTDELAAENKINSDESGFSVEALKDLCRQVFGNLYRE